MWTLRSFTGVLLSGVLLFTALRSEDALTQHHVTWAFDREVQTGSFVNGDCWVVGPVNVVAISNDLNDPAYTPRAGQNGSMVNPKPMRKQGYTSDHRSYDESLNAGRPGGRELSTENPLQLKPGQSLISSISWMYNSPEDREPGAPKWVPTHKTLRPPTRSASVLTCVAAPPPPGSFRPGYCGENPETYFNISQLRKDLLPGLDPVKPFPPLHRIDGIMRRPWLDHFPGWGGEVIHPSENMPVYGREMASDMNLMSLVVLMDVKELPGDLDLDDLLIRLVQYGIDLTSIADAGGDWEPDGCMMVGRKWPILFTGLMLDDDHMKNVGQWETMFHEDAQTFYVSQAEVDLTHSDKWSPDKRVPNAPYTAEDIGMAEWGIRHATRPVQDNNVWKTSYRNGNYAVNTGFVLAARIMKQQQAWNHDALFDYTDRAMERVGEDNRQGPNFIPLYVKAMWKGYR